MKFIDTRSQKLLFTQEWPLFSNFAGMPGCNSWGFSLAQNFYVFIDVSIHFHSFIQCLYLKFQSRESTPHFNLPFAGIHSGSGSSSGAPWGGAQVGVSSRRMRFVFAAWSQRGCEQLHSEMTGTFLGGKLTRHKL